jgi:3,4-dihydroxyphenylacetate 2,3-dioxygenase
MLYGVLGGRSYNEKVEVITPYFGSSGTGQINVIFPVAPLNPEALKG